MQDITTYTTEQLKEQRDYQIEMIESDTDVQVDFTLQELIQEIARRAQISMTRFPTTDCFDEQQERKTAICAATSF